MAARILKAPRYDSSSVRTPSTPRVGGAEKPAQTKKEQIRERVHHAPAAQRKRFDVERQRANRQVRREAIAGDPLAQLQRRSQMCQDQYISSLRTSGILGAEHTPESQKKEMSELHKAYTAMMVLQAVHPLQRGLNVQNVSTAATMGMTMALLSPNFREMTKDYVGQIKGMGQQIKDAAVLKQGRAAQENLAELADKQGTVDPKKLSGRNAAHAAKWAKRVERMEFIQRGHREPFTENSAALTQVGLAEAAYYDMRRPGADPQKVMQKYQDAMSALYDHMEVDLVDTQGLPQHARRQAVQQMRDEVSQHMRIIVGQRIDKDPEAASIFTELAHSRMSKTAPQKVFVAGTTQVVTAWNGDYQDAYTDGMVTGGSFSVRPPMDDLGHREAMARTMYSHMEQAATPADLDEILRGYMVGSAVNEDPRTVDLIEDENVRRPLEVSRTMFHSMEADGFDEKARVMIYGTAVLDAMRTIEQLHPDRAKAWQEEYGPNWNDVVKAKMAEYGDLGTQAAQRPTRESTAEDLNEVFEYDQDFEVETAEPIVPEAPRQKLRLDASAEHVEEPVVIAGELDEDTATLPQSLDEADHEPVEVSAAANFENQYAGYFTAHLSHALDQGGVSRFAAVAESLRLMNVDPGDSVTGETVAQSFQMMEHSGLGEPIQRAIYADGLTRAMQKVAAESPDVDAHLQGLYGRDWANQQVRRIEEPAAFTPPSFTGEETEAVKSRMLTEAMSEAISGDLATAQIGARPGDETASVHMAMREYLSSESPIDGGVEDQQWHLRRARIEQMKSSMRHAGLSPDAQNAVFATAFTHAVEQSNLRSPAAKTAAQELFSKKRNWRDKAYQAAAGDQGQKIAAKEYTRRKELMGLPGSSSSHAQAQAQLKQELNSSTKSKTRYEVDRHRAARKTQRQRENMHYNGYEVNSGRFQEDQPAKDSGPELG